MKSLNSLFAASTLVCLSLAIPAYAGPGGTYGPPGYGTPGYGATGYRTNSYGRYDGGFGGGFSNQYHDHDYDHDHYHPGTQPRTVVKIVEPVNVVGPGPVNRPYYDRTPNLRPAVVVQPYRNTTNYNPIMAHRPNYYNNGGWYHGDWHNNWNKSVSVRPYAWSGWGSGWNGWNGKASATVVSSPWRYGYWSYSNPYYATTANVPVYFNYSQPIVASNITADASGQFYPQAIGQVSRDQAQQIFAEARQAFFAGDLRTARSLIDQAISAMPGDTVLHQFRALVLFADRDYAPAAGTLYSVMSSGPGWDWTTMIGLYPNARIYTAQLRVLEDFCNANPGAANARFVLAYHYLTAGYGDAAAEVFRQVVAINPSDTLSAQLLASIAGTGANQVAQLPQVDPSQIDDQFLLGNWTATRNDGSRFQLILRNDGAYSWTYIPNGGGRQHLTGAFSVSDGMLILQQDGQPAMVGQIYPLAGNRFVFKLVGGDQYDPGLTFER